MKLIMLPVASLSATEIEQESAKVTAIAEAYGTDESIIDWSEQPAIIATEAGDILDGHHRFAAFQSLGFSRCRVLVVDEDFAAYAAQVGLQRAVKDAADEVGCPYTWAAA